MAYAKSLESDFPAVSSMLSNVDFDTDTVSEMTYQLVIEGKEAPAFAQRPVTGSCQTTCGPTGMCHSNRTSPQPPRW